MFPALGCVTARTNAVVTAASTAFPPAARMASPAFDAKASSEATIDVLPEPATFGSTWFPLASVPDACESGDRAKKIAGNCHLRFRGIESEALLVLLDDAGVCASAGSACASGAMEPSHVLRAMGFTVAQSLSSVRLSLGVTTTEADIDLALKAIPDAVAALWARAS